MVTVLIDTDPMPFGKHKGTTMANMPNDYLLWIYRQNLGQKTNDETTAVIKYVLEYLYDKI